MRKLIVAVLVVLGVTALADQTPANPVPTTTNVVVQVPPPGQSAQQASYNSVAPAYALVTPDDGGCKTPGAAVCTTLLAPTSVGAWRDVTVYVQNPGGADAGFPTVDSGVNNGLAAPLINVLIEVSNDGLYWTDLCNGACQPVAVSGQTVLNYKGSYTLLRVEGDSTSGTVSTVHVSAEH